MEGIVAEHLIRWAFEHAENKQMFDYTYHISHWKGRNGKEVDFVLYDGDSVQVPIEVKFQDKIKHKELGGMVKFLEKTGTRRGIVVSKLELEAKRDYVVIPASIFLLLV